MKEKYQKLANEYVVSLFPAFMLPIGMTKGTEKFFRVPVQILFNIENNAVIWYFLPSEWKKAHLKLVEEIKKDPSFLKNVYDQMIALANRQIKFGQDITPKIKSATNSQLLKFYQQFISYNIELYQYGLLLPLLDYNELTFLSDELHRILKQKNADKYFNLLTIPTKQTTVKKQELDLLRIFYKKINEPRVNISQLLKKHTKKYAWAYYVYEGPAVGEQYFQDILEDWQKRKINPKKELNRHDQYVKKVLEQQRGIIKNLELNKYEQQILNLARDGVFIKPYRRELQSCSYYFIEPLLLEIAKRLDLSLNQVRMMLPDEIKKALEKRKNYQKEIIERQKFLFYRYLQGKLICLTGDSAKAFIKKNIQEEKFDRNLTVFHGTTAFAGKVKGRVKIVNTPVDIKKMQTGDILVATTTNPNLMPAIRMAKAIITDEGGLTCHAAIVSRELRIPCVVGAKPIAQVLKDGDLVEVDANKGIIKKVK
jgi:phosphohistidine swiveling domain-containing protein